MVFNVVSMCSSVLHALIQTMFMFCQRSLGPSLKGYGPSGELDKGFKLPLSCFEARKQTTKGSKQSSVSQDDTAV
jgi:hypothetical protein